MIRNLLFDMGEVLLRFEPETFLARLDLAPEDRALLGREVFRSVEWVELDRGTLDDEAAIASMCLRVPERLHGAVRELVSHWDEPRLPVPGAYELVETLSQKGYGLYLLTNAALRHRRYWPKQPVAEFFGGRVMLSADWKLLKPDPEFFETALRLFSLDRHECLFIDDSPMNVAAAVRQGIEGLVFHGDMALLREQLRERGVDC